MRTGLLRCGLAGAILLAAAHARAQTDLQPFQMMRSLEQLQDRIAGGDHAALPMQRTMLEMTDARFLAMTDAEFEDPLNRRALLLYAMSGGNPATVQKMVARMPADDPDRRLGQGILQYNKGDATGAAAVLEKYDPKTYVPEFGAYLALVKASVLTSGHPAQAIELLDLARLLSPGTLVEEAALRRSLALALTLADHGRFLRASAQYVRSYIHSPYAGQFADAFVSGVVSLHAGLDLEAVAGVVAMMDADQQHAIYLRIARRAAIDGQVDLSAFASAKAQENADDPRALLYSSLTEVTSSTAEEVNAKLARIDRARLTEKDQGLLDAVAAVAATMVLPEVKQAASPAKDSDGVAPAADAPSPDKTEVATAPTEPLPVAPDTAAGDPDGHSKPIKAPEQPVVAEPAPHDLPAEIAKDAVPTVETVENKPADPTEAMMLDTRKKLADIDKLIGEMPR